MDELSEHLDALARDGCYRVDAVMKESAFETTQLVYFVGANGSEQGPYVRKYLDGDAGLGAAYERLWRAQRSGRRFLHLPLVLDCHAVGSRRVVVMEFVRGETLADVVYRCDPSVALACDVFPKLCEAVRELHEAFDPPLIHRDLKPSNVMLTRDNLTLIDFGIARSFDEAAEQDTNHFGTRAYAPPEQFGYGQSDARTDVYALGMLLYFCLTEKTPDAKARRAGYRGAGVPEPLRAVVERAAAFDPRDRYASVRELEQAFGEAVRRLLPSGGNGAAGNAVEAARNAARTPSGRSAAAAGEAKGAASATERIESAGPAAGWRPAAAPEAPGAAPLAALRAYPDLPAPVPPSPRAAVRGEGAFWGRVPRWAGIVWDAALALLSVLFLCVATDLAFSPEPGDVGYGGPLPARIAAYYGIAVLMFLPGFFLASDRRPLVRLVPALGRIPLKAQVVVCLALFAIGFVVAAVATGFLPRT